MPSASAQLREGGGGLECGSAEPGQGVLSVLEWAFVRDVGAHVPFVVAAFVL